MLFIPLFVNDLFTLLMIYSNIDRTTLPTEHVSGTLTAISTSSTFHLSQSILFVAY